MHVELYSVNIVLDGGTKKLFNVEWSNRRLVFAQDTADVAPLDTHGQTNTSEAHHLVMALHATPILKAPANFFWIIRIFFVGKVRIGDIQKRCLNNIQWVMFWRGRAFSRQEMEFLPLVQHGWPRNHHLCITGHHWKSVDIIIVHFLQSSCLSALSALSIKLVERFNRKYSDLD